MKRRNFIASFVAAIVAAALSLRICRALNTKPPEPQANELPKYQTISGDEDAKILPWSHIRPTKPDERPPVTPEEYAAMCALVNIPPTLPVLKDEEMFGEDPFWNGIKTTEDWSI